MKNNFEIIERAIKKGGEISPFLFLSQNLELLHSDLQGYILGLLKENNIDTQSLFHIYDGVSTLKIEEIKKFLSAGEVRPRFAFQVFVIENISRMTPQAQNACLKFFEEPGEGNIIILTNTSQSEILETILSRVQVQYIYQEGTGKRTSTTGFYYDMISSYVGQQSYELIRYIFPTKLEKTDYIDFLIALTDYITASGNFIYLLDEIHEDMNGILKNNLQGKYILDKYIIKLGV